MRVTNVSPEGVLYCQLPSRGAARLCKSLEETEAIFTTQVEEKVPTGHGHQLIDCLKVNIKSLVVSLNLMSGSSTLVLLKNGNITSLRPVLVCCEDYISCSFSLVNFFQHLQ